MEVVIGAECEILQNLAIQAKMENGKKDSAYTLVVM